MKKVIKRIFIGFFIAVVVLVYGASFYRIFEATPPSSMKKIVISEEIEAAYERESESFSIKEMKLSSYIESSGLFQIKYVNICESAGELQLVFFYRDKALLTLQNLFPDCAQGDYPFLLTLRDENGEEYSAEVLSEQDKLRYHYTRAAFSSLPFDTCQSLTLEIRDRAHPDAEEPIARFAVYHTAMPTKLISYKP